MQNTTPKISIVFPCYNGEMYLYENLESIKHLSNINEIEVIIVDNNSNDSSKQIIKSFKGINLILIEKSKNLGFAEACNIGVKNSNGEYVFITNQDVTFPKNFFQMTFKVFNELNKNGDIILCPAVVFFNNYINYYGAKIHYLGFSYTPKMYQKIPRKFSTFKTLKASGCSMFLKKDIFIKLNGFDSYLFMYHEDSDFSLKALRNKISIYTTNKTLLQHQKIHGLINPITYYYIERNRIIYIYKNIDNIKKLIPYIIFAELLLILQSFFIGKFKIRFKIYKFLIKNRNQIKNIRHNAFNSKTLKVKANQLDSGLDPIILGRILSKVKIFRYIIKILNYVF
ncbi:MAG: glycosyltransferase family 2 protein [Promethearchaeota archaeon]